MGPNANTIVTDYRASVPAVCHAQGSHKHRSQDPLLPCSTKSKLYLSAATGARHVLGKRLTAPDVVEHLLHDSWSYVLLSRIDGRRICKDCRGCAEDIGDVRYLNSRLQTTFPLRSVRFNFAAS